MFRLFRIWLEKKNFRPLVIDIFRNLRVKNRDYGGAASVSGLFWIWLEKNFFFTVGGPWYDFWSLVKIKLKPGQNGYHSTTFSMRNRSNLVRQPFICHKNLTLKSHFRSNTENCSNWVSWKYAWYSKSFWICLVFWKPRNVIFHIFEQILKIKETVYQQTTLKPLYRSPRKVQKSLIYENRFIYSIHKLAKLF